ncbi:MAG TPA: hypothetical protein VHU83_14540 [Bryobacteraceae bacterium]|jgi:hypothetical protein|nr:hypothetical protein [Bryobacteraceae bacterium]
MELSSLIFVSIGGSKKAIQTDAIRTFRCVLTVAGLIALIPCKSLPADSLSGDTVTVDPSSKNTGTLASALLFGGPFTVDVSPVHGGITKTFPTSTGIASNRGTTGDNINGLDFYTPGTILTQFKPNRSMSITMGGRIGIGTPNPERDLEIDDAMADAQLGLKGKNGMLWTIQSSQAVTGANANLSGTFQIIDGNGSRRLAIDQTGKVAVDVLQINGGSDVAEPFPVWQQHVTKGSVVVIDEMHPGQLKLSSKPYDTQVAGIVSGASGVKPGLSLQQRGFSDGQDVALSGRVYALADAGREPIHPGDLLTTSSRAGYCMKAVNRAKSQGAILGKAMSPLESGQGTILVLVSLQ